MKLLIISHTEHYFTAEGTLVGLGSTVTEINHLLVLFDEIVHLAMLHPGPAPASSLPYVSERIRFVPIPTVGGQGLFAKFKILWYAPKTISLVRQALKATDWFQFRAPTGIGVFVIPYLVFFSTKKGWFKYAGNWKQRGAPKAYRFQKWLLLKQSRKVTLNGFWEDQPAHCLSFENPCLTAKELERGRLLVGAKGFASHALEFCFVGRLESAKGFGLLLTALDLLPLTFKQRIKCIHVVGEGQDSGTYQALAKETALPFVFYGVLSRDAVHRVYEKSHALLLPSASEGFPKVLSEAMNYGCIPLVSNVSSIGQYIQDGVHGFLMESLTGEALLAVIKRFMSLNEAEFEVMQNRARTALSNFGYLYYVKRLSDEVVK